VHGIADRVDAVRGDRAATVRLQGAVGLDPQHRDLVAAGVDCQQVAAVATPLSEPCEAIPLPVPTPPATNGEPGIGVSIPSAWRSKAPIVFTPPVLSLTYTCPTTGDVVEAAPVASTAKAAARTAARAKPLHFKPPM
jgi:hypothetical protein